MTVDLSIIIVSWNVREKLRDCLLSLQNTQQDISFEILLIDNASTDKTAEMIQKEFPEIDFDQNNINEGLAKPWNRAAKKARGKYLLFLNDDTVVFDHTLDRTVAYVKQHPECGVLGCKMLHTDHTIQPSVRRFPTIFDHLLQVLKIPHIAPRVLDTYVCKNFDYTKTQVVDQVMGAYFLMPRVVFDTLGGFDEKFFIWLEEVDFCRRLKNTQWQTVYYADATIVHHGGASFSQLSRFKAQPMFIKSMLHYIAKHHDFIRP